MIPPIIFMFVEPPPPPSPLEVAIGEVLAALAALRLGGPAPAPLIFNWRADRESRRALSHAERLPDG